MRGAQANLETMIVQSSWQQTAEEDCVDSSSSSLSDMDSQILLPFSSFLSTVDPLLPEDPLQSYLAEVSQERLRNSSSNQQHQSSTSQHCDVQQSQASFSSLLPNIGGINSPDPFLTTQTHPQHTCLDDTEKSRRKQWKAELRKQRNKEAARRSNLNKKLIRQQLEKKSLELWEENLQLQQDIQTLHNKLRHIRHVSQSMHHVCCHPMVSH